MTTTPKTTTPKTDTAQTLQSAIWDQITPWILDFPVAARIRWRYSGNKDWLGEIAWPPPGAWRTPSYNLLRNLLCLWRDELQLEVRPRADSTERWRYRFPIPHPGHLAPKQGTKTTPPVAPPVLPGEPEPKVSAETPQEPKNQKPATSERRKPGRLPKQQKPQESPEPTKPEPTPQEPAMPPLASTLCEADILRVFAKDGKRHQELVISSLLSRAGCQWSRPVIQATVAWMKDRGVLDFTHDERGAGYGLTEWHLPEPEPVDEIGDSEQDHDLEDEHEAEEFAAKLADLAK